MARPTARPAAHPMPTAAARGPAGEGTPAPAAATASSELPGQLLPMALMFVPDFTDFEALPLSYLLTLCPCPTASFQVTTQLAPELPLQPSCTLAESSQICEMPISCLVG